MIDPAARGERAAPVAHRKADYEVGVDQVQRCGVQVEQREDAGLYAELKTARARSGSRQRKRVADCSEARVKTRAGDVMRLIVSGETRLARIGQQRREQFTRRQRAFVFA